MSLRASLLAVALALAPALADACTRVVYHGPDGRYLTARSMDWKLEIDGQLWIFAGGMARDGAAGPGRSNGCRATAA